MEGKCYFGHDRYDPSVFPCPPCDRKDPFICVIYCAGDEKAGLRTIQLYHEMGFPVWYDTTVSSNTVWTGETQDALAGCRVAVFLYSANAFYSDYFWQSYEYAHKLNKPHLTLHFDDNRNRLDDQRHMFQMERWVDADADDYPDHLEKYMIDSWIHKAAENSMPTEKKDLGTLLSPWNDPFRGTVTVNLRTHEAWDQNRRPLKPVSAEELNDLRNENSRIFTLLPMSYAFDYTPGADDGYICSNLYLKYEEDKREKERKALELAEHKKQQDEDEIGLHGEFPEGYPYMDEFEYIDKNYE